MKTIAFLFLIFISASVIAQDKIIKRDKTEIECYILEIGLDEIKYKLEKDGDYPSISIAVDDVFKIIMRNGREMMFHDPMQDMEVYIDDKKNAIKFHFLSPISNHLGFSFERSLKPGRSYETELGIIGVGYDFNDYETSSGVFFSAGYKFMKTPDFYVRRMKYAHLLKGSYIKPQVLFSIYSVEGSDPYYQNYSYDNNYFSGVLLLNLGKQIVFDNAFLVDYSFGVGYGFTEENIRRRNMPQYYYEGSRAYHYGFVGGTDGFPLVVAARLKIGILVD